MGETTGSWDLLVIGGGPGGYVAAIRGAQLGLKVACVEERESLGGTCLNEGCIPSKALLESAWKYREARDHLAAHGVVVGEVGLDLAALHARKGEVVGGLTRGIDTLFKKYRVTRLKGRGVLREPTMVAVTHPDGTTGSHTARAVLLATGAVPTALPALPVDGERIVTSREALGFTEVPRRLAVVGAGAIGLELASAWRRLGAEVTVIEALPELFPPLDETVRRHLMRQLKLQGLAPRLGTRVVEAGLEADGVTLSLEDGQGNREVLECDRVLVAVGRRPDPVAAGADALGVERDERGFIPVDQRFQTSLPGLYAVGDLIPGPMLAHKAMEEGFACAQGLAGHPVVIPDHRFIPAVVYTRPEVATVGVSEQRAKGAGLAVVTGQFPFLANGRARAAGEADGVIKVVAEAGSGRLLGVHMLGPHVSELAFSAAAALAAGWTAGRLAHGVAPHPTLSEALREALLAVEGAAVHT